MSQSLRTSGRRDHVPLGSAKQKILIVLSISGSNIEVGFPLRLTSLERLRCDL
jgi:hypothetical protein